MLSSYRLFIIPTINKKSAVTKFLSLRRKYLIFYHAFRNDIYIDRVLYGGRGYLRGLFRDALQEE